MNVLPRAGLLMRIPPPLLFVVTFFAGAGMQRLVPLGLGSPGLTVAARVAGFALVSVGVLLMLSSVGIFLQKRTTIIPFGAASRLVSIGPYRFTRNPMYLSLVLVYVGVAGILTEIWPLILLPLPTLVVDRIVIPFEEARLRELFGDALSDYCKRVRRWI